MAICHFVSCYNVLIDVAINAAFDHIVVIIGYLT